MQVLAASDSDADEEAMPINRTGTGSSSRGTVERRTGSIAAMSGANDVIYMEYSTPRGQGVRPQHPLFKLRH